MKAVIIAYVKLEEGEIEEGDMIDISFDDFAFKPNPSELFYPIIVSHEITISKAEDIVENSDIIVNKEIFPRISTLEEQKMIFDFIKHWESFEDFQKNTINYTYDYGEEKEIWSLCSSYRSTYLNGSVFAQTGVFKYHIKEGKVSDGLREAEYKRIDI